ncbi:uncharacterized protein DUF397 [Murinocardiopsis flavida]|uniref:Uncharacterized protein DUF397 n=1 Tax=Murinocardiopsis flavida TaxID=645275 RepID=A0A2P8DSD6_9ACTN|nr:DUF397 domain-containing protein [Murinocardiopsis flavida]PSL00105.1 uncharacterized protein DUF397 [Murinocardiopsis flavida]
MPENWRTSSYSGGRGDCVEVADTPTSVKIRDTRNRDLGYLTFPAEQWAALLTSLKSG